MVLEGGNHPALRLGRREPHHAHRKPIRDTVRRPIALGQSRHLTSYVSVTLAVPRGVAFQRSVGLLGAARWMLGNVGTSLRNGV